MAGFGTGFLNTLLQGQQQASQLGIQQELAQRSADRNVKAQTDIMQKSRELNRQDEALSRGRQVTEQDRMSDVINYANTLFDPENPEKTNILSAMQSVHRFASENGISPEIADTVFNSFTKSVTSAIEFKKIMESDSDAKGVVQAIANGDMDLANELAGKSGNPELLQLAIEARSLVPSGGGGLSNLDKLITSNLTNIVQQGIAGGSNDIADITEQLMEEIDRTGIGIDRARALLGDVGFNDEDLNSILPLKTGLDAITGAGPNSLLDSSPIDTSISRRERNAIESGRDPSTIGLQPLISGFGSALSSAGKFIGSRFNMKPLTNLSQATPENRIIANNINRANGLRNKKIAFGSALNNINNNTQENLKIPSDEFKVDNFDLYKQQNPQGTMEDFNNFMAKTKGRGFMNALTRIVVPNRGTSVGPTRVRERALGTGISTLGVNPENRRSGNMKFNANFNVNKPSKGSSVKTITSKNPQDSMWKKLWGAR